jgi:hypothetical protein
MGTNENNSSAYWQTRIDAIDGQITGAKTGLDDLQHARGVALEKLVDAERQERAKRQTAADRAAETKIKRAKDMTQAERDAFLRDHRKKFGQ